MGQVIPVSLGSRSYNIHIGSGMIADGKAAGLLAEVVPGRRACLVTHPKLEAGYAAPLAQGLEAQGIVSAIVTILPGERSKNLANVARLYSAFARQKLDRKSVVVAVGGGVLGDLAGFAAASYLRGIGFVQVPTTLLAQVDASVGGKTGVDLPEGKNLVGAFHQPLSVLIDPDTLRTLPLRELRAGLAEVIKYGIIYDGEFFRRVARDAKRLLEGDEVALAHAIARSCEIKADVVAQDETEQGLRAILNFGHTIGHALEAVTQYRRYKHGEAVAIGMVSACLVGEELNQTPSEVTEALIGVLNAVQLPTAFPVGVNVTAILEAAQRDKKTLDGKLRFVLATGLGTVQVEEDVPANAIRAALARQR